VPALYLDFSEAFGTVSPSTLTDKLMKCGPDKLTLKRAENWLTARAQSTGFTDRKSTQRLVTSGAPWGSIMGPTTL